MSNIARKLAGAGLAAGFVLGLGGLAYAQTADDNSSTTTTAPSASTPAPAQGQDPAHCDHGGGGFGSGRGAPSNADPGSL